MKIGKSISIQYWNVQDIVNLMDKKVYDWQLLIRAGQGYVEIIHLAAGLLTPGLKKIKVKFFQFSDRKLNRPAVKIYYVY